MTTRICDTCGENKPLEMFPIRIKSNGKKYHKHRCYDCVRNEQKKYNIKNPVRVWCISTLSQHKHNGYIINISLDELYNYVKSAKYCYICGKELDWTIGKKHSNHNSPTLDRLNNEKEINIRNIQILCRDCNISKSNKTILELVSWAEQVIKVYKE